ncbi:uncharacterized protein LOC122278903 [Carya illinoinensis]|uniref:Uncharacterized protein n=1 Tax=Carya illinoinensis TaxID=32201 RepID=A0A8T1PEB8_CARIL|nr:uncharacterized protein LOC122278903 [Carya illinoinensis]KAG6640034.1 hypothetical protein CIPAW_10G143600 [Carya illinoinensis]
MVFVFTSIIAPLTSRWPLIVYSATWTAILTVTVALASLAPEVAFVSAISSSSTVCDETEGSVRVPLDSRGEILCLPAHLLSKSKIDFIVPPVFAAVVVAASACLVRALCLWEDDEPH